MLKHFFNILGQFFLLWVIYYGSTLLVGVFHLPISGSVLGMLILFGLLSAGILKEEWITAGAAPLLTHLAFFFIPIAVGLMEWGDLFVQKGYLLFLPLVLSTLVALVVTGKIVEFLAKKQSS